MGEGWDLLGGQVEVGLSVADRTRHTQDYTYIIHIDLSIYLSIYLYIPDPGFQVNVLEPL